MSASKDGRWAWLVMVCVLCSQMIVGGIALSGGLFFVIFEREFGSNPVETSWLCSLPFILWFMAPPIGTMLTNRYGFRTSAFVGGLITGTGVSLGYFASSKTFLFVSYGCLAGLGLGINYTATFTALNEYFDKYKTIATGIASTGNNIGLIIYSKVIILLENEYGWRGMMLVIGAIAFNLCLWATAMFPVQPPPDMTSTVSKDQKPGKRKIANLSVFKKLSFISWCFSNVFVNISFSIYFLLLPSYSKEAGFEEENFSDIWLSYGISNITGKVFFSFLANHPRMNTVIIYAVCLALSGLATALHPIILTRIGVLVLAGCVGFFSCVTGGLLPAVVYSIVGYSRFADGIGMSVPFKAFGNLIGGPFGGALYASSGSFASSFYLSGGSMIVASLLMVQPIFHQVSRDTQHKEMEIHTIAEKVMTSSDDELEQLAFIESNDINRKGISETA